MPLCPKCGTTIIYTAHQNPRNGRWTVLPLEMSPGPFSVSEEKHEAVDILGVRLGDFPISTYNENSQSEYIPHSPSHFLGDH